MKKELERTNRISVSTVIFILAVVVSFLTFKKPDNVFNTDVKKTYNAIVNKKYLLSDLSSIKDSNSLVIDVRTPFEYKKGHFKNAINLPISHLLEEKSKDFFNKTKEEGRKNHIYGTNPNESSNAWMFLYQIGYTNIDIIDAKYNRFKDKFVSSKSIEKPKLDYAAYMKKASEGRLIVKKAKKKVLKIRKKKKKGAEGGC